MGPFRLSEAYILVHMSVSQLTLVTLVPLHHMDVRRDSYNEAPPYPSLRVRAQAIHFIFIFGEKNFLGYTSQSNLPLQVMYV